MSSPDPSPDATPATSYTGAFFDEITPLAFASARVVVPFVHDLVRPRSVVDVGCGAGAWLAVWYEQGVEDGLGLDGDYVDTTRLHIPADEFRAVDLERPPSPDRRFDLAMSVEVAEHLAPAAADGFIALLTTLAPVVLFSAAIPGQGGVEHVNEQWPAYWAQRFAAQGFEPYDIVRPRVWGDPAVASFYAQNLLIFAHPDAPAAATLARTQPAFPLTAPAVAGPAAPERAGAPLPLVHPGLLDALEERRAATRPPQPGLGSALREVGHAGRRAFTARRGRPATGDRSPSTR